MHILITGGAGFIGVRLARRLLADNHLRTAAGPQPITRLTVLDHVPASGLPEDPRIRILTGDAADAVLLRSIIGDGVDAVFHLAAVVSVAAERDFDLGMTVNLHGTLALLEACRATGRTPLFIKASSAAVYGGPLAPEVGEATALFPQTSYGMQKAVGELLVDDYSRKGFVDGRCLRLPTIIVRPGAPNLAASSFASSLVREPLMGRAYTCPVPRETAVCVLSVRRVVESFVHAAALPAAALGHTRAVQLPGLTMTVADLVTALGVVGGAGVVARLSFAPLAEIVAIVKGWPVRFTPTRSAALGFAADASAEEIISDFVTDELDGKVVR
ncbi:MAG: GDP-mannose 4,6-dehydratase [Planctomycetes bacterium]|nr:GDP-mannose 4,6-dehydratase [Planctomycetota bacterium]